MTSERPSEEQIMPDQSTAVPVVYKELPDFPGYRIGDDGSAWTCRKTGYGYGRRGQWKQLKPIRSHSTGRLFISIDRRQMAIHRLVLLAFVGPCPDGKIVLHYDGDHTNNCLANLRYGTYEENEADKERHGRRLRGDRHPIAKLTVETVRLLKAMLAEGRPLLVIARHFGVSKKTVLNIKQGKVWKWVN